MKHIIKNISLPLLSTIFMMIALGFFNTLVYVKIDHMGYSEFYVGLATSLYYLGLLIGSVCISSYVKNHGYIKSYVTSTVLMVITIIIYDLSTNIALWLFLRVVVGFSLAASFVVTQSWVMCLTNAKNRGGIMAIYNIILYGSVAIGQVLIGFAPDSQTPFLYISILIALSILPLSMAKSAAPETKNSVSLSLLELFKISKTAKISTIGAGIIQASMYGLLPIYCILRGFSKEEMALFMSVLVFGGMLLQYPLGRISDYIDRAKVIVILFILIIITSLLIIFMSANIYILVVLLFFFGGLSFAIYPISLNILGDRVEPSSITSINQGVLFSNSFGAIIGPVIAAYPVHLFGYNGLFVFTALVSLIILILIFSLKGSKRF